MDLLQPYCNQAGTGAYAVDKPSPRLSQKTCEIGKFTDDLVQARTHHLRLLIRDRPIRFRHDFHHYQVQNGSVAGAVRPPASEHAPDGDAASENGQREE